MSVPPASPAVVQLTIAPLPEHVRTARLVAVAVARLLGMPAERLDEVRLAVGEACTLAVQRAVDDPGAAVQVDLADQDGLIVHVRAPGVGGPDAGAGGQSLDDLALAVVQGLVPRFGRRSDELTLHWPTSDV